MFTKFIYILFAWQKSNKLTLLNVCSFKLISFFFILVLIIKIFPTNIVFGQIYCSNNTFVSNGLIGLDAFVDERNLVLNAYMSKTISGISMPSTSEQFDFFIDVDQNINTGDPRPGAIRGVDYRVTCIFLLDEPSCHLYALPKNVIEMEGYVGPLQARLIRPNLLQVLIPDFTNAADVIAFARGGVSFYGNKTGNGDRCPEYGVFDTSTRKVVLRQSAMPVEKTILDSTGPDLSGWRFQTFGDQFRIKVDFKYPSQNFSGRIELDTDRNLNTGLVQTPFLIPSPFNEIPSWGWDVAIEFQGDVVFASDPTPISLDFGLQSPYIIPLQSTYAFPYRFPFGEKYNDGRWYLDGNQLVLEGSLSILDPRQWRIVQGTGLVVDRKLCEGKVIGRIFTRSGVNISDMIPKKDNAFDFGTGKKVPAINWNKEAVVSGTSPSYSLPQCNLIQIDAQIDGENLVVKATLERLESTWLDTRLAIFLETGAETESVIPINNEIHNTETILADYVFFINRVDLAAYFGYTTVLLKVNDFEEGRDSGLNVQYSLPYVDPSPAKFISTIPLEAIGNPNERIRLYVATLMDNYIQDVAPLEPITFFLEKTNFANIKIVASPAEAGSVSGGGRFKYGNEIILKAVANNSYLFVNWTDDGKVVSNQKFYTFTATGDRNLTANFKKTQLLPGVMMLLLEE